ncbi:MAG: zf-HC2 domain-containing protein [Chloroflexota bacterium]|nr:zf-HC2 domain-containing protein [Chloroflexota bacterium]
MDERQDQELGSNSNDAPADAGAGDNEPRAPWRRSAQPNQHLDTDALSAFLDNRLDEPDRTIAASHLARCDACQGDLGELRTTIALLRGLPQYRPRRSFELGPDHASQGQPNRFARLLPLIPALRVAAAVVALLLVGVTSADLRFSDATPPAGRQAIPGVTATSPGAPNAAEGAQSSEDPSAADEAGPGTGAEAPAAEQADRALQAAPGAAPTATEPDPTPETSIAAPAEAEPAADRAPATGSTRPSAWRLAEVGLALLLLWLLVGLVGLQRVKRSAGRRAGA